MATTSTTSGYQLYWDPEKKQYYYNQTVDRNGNPVASSPVSPGISTTGIAALIGGLSNLAGTTTQKTYVGAPESTTTGGTTGGTTTTGPIRYGYELNALRNATGASLSPTGMPTQGGASLYDQPRVSNPYFNQFTGAGQPAMPMPRTPGQVNSPADLYNDLLTQRNTQTALNAGANADAIRQQNFERMGTTPQVTTTYNPAITGASNFANQDIVNLYRTYLGRDPDQASYENLVAQFGDTVDPAEVQTFRNAATAENAITGYSPSGTTSTAYEKALPVGARSLSDFMSAGNIQPAAVTDTYSIPGSARFSRSPGVASLYQSYLGREPDLPGYDYWAQKFGAEIDPEETQSFKTAIKDYLLNSGSDYKSQYGEDLYNKAVQSAGVNIGDLYKTYLGREPEQGGYEYWNQQFGSEIDPTEMQTFRNAAQQEITNRGYADGGQVTQEYMPSYQKQQNQMALNQAAQQYNQQYVSQPNQPPMAKDIMSQYNTPRQSIPPLGALKGPK